MARIRRSAVGARAYAVVRGDPIALDGLGFAMSSALPSRSRARTATGRTNRSESSGPASVGNRGSDFSASRPVSAHALTSSRLRELNTNAGSTPKGASPPRSPPVLTAAFSARSAPLGAPDALRPHTTSVPSRSRSEPAFTTAFARPVLSKKAPLRTLLLDPESNNMPRSRTRSEFKKNLRKVNVPHWSYDIDGDGEVSHADYRIGKQYDLSGSGRLSPDERTGGRKMMASQFFKNHQRDAHLYGSQWTARKGEDGAAENAERLANVQSFNYSLCKLKMKEKRLINGDSYDMTVCMSDTLPDAPPIANYYPDTHSGSRSTLFHNRNVATREMAQKKLDIAETKRPQFSTRRTSLITNWAFENG